MAKDNDIKSELELVVDELYSLADLNGQGLKMLRFYSQNSIFINGSDEGYHFKHVRFDEKNKNKRFQYVKSFKIPDRTGYTQFDEEWYEDELHNCCGPLRLGGF